MKKIVLGLLALSAISFAASNPGDELPSAGGHDGSVGVPMEVRVNILPQEGKLVLVDENNKLIDKLIFDHGDIIKGAAAADLKVEKTVKLRTDGKSGKDTFGAGTVTFLAKDAAGTNIKSGVDFLLNGHGAASGQTLKSKLVYRESVINLAGNEKEVETKVQSIIPATEINGAAKEGLYIGSGTFEATVHQN